MFWVRWNKHVQREIVKFYAPIPPTHRYTLKLKTVFYEYKNLIQKVVKINRRQKRLIKICKEWTYCHMKTILYLMLRHRVCILRVSLTTDSCINCGSLDRKILERSSNPFIFTVVIAGGVRRTRHRQISCTAATPVSNIRIHHPPLHPNHHHHHTHRAVFNGVDLKSHLHAERNKVSLHTYKRQYRP